MTKIPPAGSNEAPKFSQASRSALRTIQSRLLQHERLFHFDWIDIARFVLSHFSAEPVTLLSVSELRSLYMTLPGALTKPLRTVPSGSETPEPPNDHTAPFVPLDPVAFAQFLARYSVHLVALPREVLARLYSEASDDLRAIQTNIETCRTLRDKHRAVTPKSRSPIQNRHSRQSETHADEDHQQYSDDESWAQVYKFFLEENHRAQSEILDFLATGIKSRALGLAQNPVWGAAYPHPYSYRESPISFDPAAYSDVANKFDFDHAYDPTEWLQKYRDDTNMFFQELDGFLEDCNAVAYVLDSITEHHRAHARGTLLRAALDAYHTQNWDVFATLAVVQIEGLFLDYCEDLGVPPKELARSTLPAKVQAILRHNGSFAHYPFYAYRLPVVRNHLAHGRSLESEPDRRAKLLFLDLTAVIRLVRRPELLVNECVELAKSSDLHSGEFAQDALLAQCFFQLEVSPPEFYGLSTQWRALLDGLDHPATLTLVEGMVADVADSDPDDPRLAVLRVLVQSFLRRSGKKHEWQRVLGATPWNQLRIEGARYDRSSWRTIRNWVEVHVGQ